MIKKESRNSKRKKRHRRIRKKMFGTMDKPRLVVFKSHKNIYAQVINDTEGNVLTTANTLQEDVRDNIKKDMSQLDIAGLVGKKVAEKVRKLGVEKVVFDRAGYKYHGRVKALAGGAKKAGLRF